MTRQELEDLLLQADENGNQDDVEFLLGELDALDKAETPARDVKAEYEAMGPGQQAYTALDDILRIGGNLGIGARDRLAAGVRSFTDDMPYADAFARERQMTDDAWTRAGSAGLAADVGGSMALGSAASRGGLSLFNYLDDAAPLWKRLVGSTLAGTAEGGAYGTLSAAGEGRDLVEGSQSGMLAGGLSGMGAEAISSIGRWIGNRGLGKPTPTPGEDQIAADVAAGYKRLEDDGIRIRPEAVADLNDSIDRNIMQTVTAPRDSTPRALSEVQRLQEFSPSVQAPDVRYVRVLNDSDGVTNTTTSVNNKPPKSRKVDQQRKSDVTRESTRYNVAPDRGMTLYELEDIRKGVRRNTKLDEAERFQGNRIIEQIDDFGRSLGPNDVSSNRNINIQDAVADLHNTRELAHRRMKHDEIAGELKKGRRNIEASSGGDTSKILRDRVKSMLNTDRRTMGYSPDEVQQMEEIVKGGTFGNLMRSAGDKLRKLPGQSAGAAAGGGIGYALGGTGGAIAGVPLGIAAVTQGLGGAANKLAERSTEKQIEGLLDTIRRGGTKMPARGKGPAPSSKQLGDLARLIMFLETAEQTSP